jgi:hypothetical protein
MIFKYTVFGMLWLRRESQPWRDATTNQSEPGPFDWSETRDQLVD